MDEHPKGPRIIKLPSIGREGVGFVYVAEQNSGIPFPIKRTFWINNVPPDVIRGHHTHYELEQVLVGVAGKTIIRTEDSEGNKDEFKLESPDRGLYLPPLCWHTMEFSEQSVLLSLASTEYREDDYIRDYQRFKEVTGR